jgi:leucyl aminopeptidase (aminopeptidase T)
MSCDHRWKCDGFNTDHLFNGAVVKYTDATGEQHSSKVLDTDPSNPCNAHKIRRYVVADVGVGTEAGAQAFGNTLLAEQKRLARAVYECVHCGHEQHEHPFA